MINIHSALNLKTELLCKGLFLDSNSMDYYNTQGISFGRKGGAGPLAGRYFLLEDNKTLVNVALWEHSTITNLYLGKKEGDYFNIHQTEGNESYCRLKLVPEPAFYDPSFKTSDGIPMKKIALVHGIDCLASTIFQRCKYWACGEGCRFCGIELSLKYNTTIEEKNYRQMNEVIAQAKKEHRCSHMTLTSGTEEGDDKGAKRYIELLKGIKKVHIDIPLHIQIEPMENFEFIDELKKAGADTIGIHIEILDEALRKEITPGKAKIPYQLFEEIWKYSLKIFGKNQVETFVLTGFENDLNEVNQKLEKIISLGVIPFITPVRGVPNFRTSLPITDYKKLIKTYIIAARLMKQYDVNPLKNKAGCVRCGGCSAINEAYLYV
jgi:radical SAM protein (TIGR04043 family)